MILYCPSPSVTTVRDFSISAGLAASTETPGSTAPDASRTSPARPLAPVCALAAAGNSIDATATSTADDSILRLMGALLHSAIQRTYSRGVCAAETESA